MVETLKQVYFADLNSGCVRKRHQGQNKVLIFLSALCPGNQQSCLQENSKPVKLDAIICAQRALSMRLL